MKKTLFIVLLIALIALPLTAAPAFDLKKASEGQFGVGLNLGTNLGAAVKLDNKDWDLYANIGFGVVGSGLALEVGAELPVTEFKIGDAPFAVNVGGMVPLFFSFNTKAFAVGFLGTGSVSYDFKDIPLNLYIRLGLGVNLIIAPEFKFGLGYSGAIGGVWTF